MEFWRIYGVQNEAAGDQLNFPAVLDNGKKMLYNILLDKWAASYSALP